MRFVSLTGWEACQSAHLNTSSIRICSIGFILSRVLITGFSLQNTEYNSQIIYDSSFIWFSNSDPAAVGRGVQYTFADVVN